MNTKDLINFMTEGAPGAIIVMRPSDLKGFAREVAKQSAKEVRPVRKRGLTSTSEQAEILQAILEVWPQTRIRPLALALGVSHAWIHKLLKMKFDGDTQTNIPDDETLQEAAQRLANETCN